MAYHWGAATLDWALYWVLAAALVGVSGWFARTGRAARAGRSVRAWGRYASDVAIIATVLVLVIAVVTNGRGCVRSSPCFCDEGDTACIEQYCPLERKGKRVIEYQSEPIYAEEDDAVEAAREWLASNKL